MTDLRSSEKPHANGGRIEILDGLRALAILLVIGFHYFSRWTPPRNAQNLYPYGNAFSEVTVFSLGYLGVELFFIVSGFVIAMTLFGSSGPLDFVRKRFARLVPTMLLCSVITFIFVSLISPSHFFAVRPMDFLASLSFIDPDFLRLAFKRQFGIVDAAYWSLFIEVKFYAWACLLFFALGSGRFLRCFFGFYVFTMALDTAAKLLGSSGLARIAELVLFPDYLSWFAAGVGFYFLFKRQQMGWATGLIAVSLAVLLFKLVAAPQALLGEWVFTLLFYGLFMAFVYRPRWMSVFALKPMVMIGGASYSLYLLHQRLGVSLIADIAHATGLWGTPASVAVAILVTVVCTVVSLLIYRFWELPSKRWILRISSRRPIAAAYSQQQFSSRGES